MGLSRQAVPCLYVNAYYKLEFLLRYAPWQELRSCKGEFEFKIATLECGTTRTPPHKSKVNFAYAKKILHCVCRVASRSG